MWSEVGERLMADLHAHPRVAALIAVAEEEVTTGRLSPGAAARRLLAAFRGEG